jgi:peptidoglycan DL-endopeptidase CwlO
MALGSPPLAPLAGAPRWSPPGDKAPEGQWAYDLKRGGWVPPDAPKADDRTQLVMPLGWQPKHREMPFHVVYSPPGVPAPPGSYSYTPERREVHAPGTQPPVEEVNLSLIPAGRPYPSGGTQAPGPTSQPGPPPAVALRPGAGGPPPPRARLPSPGMRPGGGAPPPTGMPSPGPNPTPLGMPPPMQMAARPGMAPPGAGQDAPGPAARSGSPGGADPGLTPAPSGGQTLDDWANAIILQAAGVGSGEDVGSGQDDPNEQRTQALQARARSYEGTPYVLGGNDPARGIDCSGFVTSLLRGFGAKISGRPTTTTYRSQLAAPVSWDDIRPGDVLLSAANPRDPTSGEHMALYVGGGLMAESTTARNERGGNGVRIRPVEGTNLQPHRMKEPVPGLGDATEWAQWSAGRAEQGKSPGTNVHVLSAGDRQGGLAGVPESVRGQIAQVAQEEGVDPALFAALIRQESGFKPGARSGAGAIGLTQLMPATARGLGVDPNDLMQNLKGGARYLRQQLQAAGGDVEKALAAYNAGPGVLSKPRERWPGETQRYVPAVLGYYNQYKQGSDGGGEESGDAAASASSPERFPAGWKPSVPGLKQPGGTKYSVSSLGAPEGYPQMPGAAISSRVPQGPEVRMPRNVAPVRSGAFGEGGFDYGEAAAGQGQGRRVGAGQEPTIGPTTPTAAPNPRQRAVLGAIVALLQARGYDAQQAQGLAQRAQVTLTRDGRIAYVRLPDGMTLPGDDVETRAAQLARTGQDPVVAAIQGAAQAVSQALAPSPPTTAAASQAPAFGAPTSGAPEGGGSLGPPAASPATAPAAAAAQALPAPTNADFQYPQQGAIPGTNVPMEYGGSSSPVPRGPSATAPAAKDDDLTPGRMYPVRLPNGGMVRGPNGGNLYNDGSGHTVEIGDDGRLMSGDDQITPAQTRAAIDFQLEINRRVTEQQAQLSREMYPEERERALQTATDQASIDLDRYYAQQQLSDEHFPTRLAQEAAVGNLATDIAARRAQRELDIQNQATRPASVNGMPAYQEGVTGAVTRVPINAPPEQTWGPGVRTSTDPNTGQITVSPGEFPSGTQARYGGRVLQPQVGLDAEGNYTVPEAIPLTQPATEPDPYGRQWRRQMTGPDQGVAYPVEGAPAIPQRREVQISGLPQLEYDASTGVSRQVAPGMGISGRTVYQINAPGRAAPPPPFSAPEPVGVDAWDSGTVTGGLDIIDQLPDPGITELQQSDIDYRNRALDLQQQASERPYNEMTKEQAADLGYRYASLQQQTQESQANRAERQQEFAQQQQVEQQRLGLQREQVEMPQTFTLPRGGLGRISPLTGQMQIAQAPEPEPFQEVRGGFIVPAGRSLNIMGQQVSGGPNPWQGATYNVGGPGGSLGGYTAPQWSPPQMGYGSWSPPQMQQQSWQPPQGMGGYGSGMTGGWGGY